MRWTKKTTRSLKKKKMGKFGGRNVQKSFDDGKKRGAKHNGSETKIGDLVFVFKLPMVHDWSTIIITVCLCNEIPQFATC